MILRTYRLTQELEWSLYLLTNFRGKDLMILCQNGVQACSIARTSLIEHMKLLLPRNQTASMIKSSFSSAIQTFELS